MHRRRLRALAAAAAGVALAAASPAVPGHAAPGGEPAARQSARQADAKPATIATVTLITGDRVTLRGGAAAAVEPGPGRAGMRFSTYRAAGHSHVVPADALQPLRAGALDRRLFDVTLLAEQGHTGEAALPLILAYPRQGAKQGAAARQRAAAGGATVERELPAVGAVAVRAGADRAALWGSLTSGTASARSLAPGVAKVWLNVRRHVSLDTSVAQIGAPAAWQAGLDGTGVTVGIVDTGVDGNHEDLAGRVTSEIFTDTTYEGDQVGHGTHVASIVAGTGAKSGGKYRGVAPGAKLLDARVCELDGCWDDDILAGMTWVAEQGAQVANLSLGGYDTPEEDILEEGLRRLTAEHGTLFVVAAGNSGPSAGTVDSPGSSDAALTVGAVDRTDAVADFSSRGPRVGDDGLKPDITAPGVEIVAARSSGDVIGGPGPAEGYTVLSGTSMATPHVAGAAAILAQKYPAWTPEQRKDALMAAAQPSTGARVFDQGAGRTDVARALGQTVTTGPASISFGRQLWPHGDDAPITKTITYRNAGTAAVTLDLAVQADEGVPAGAFTLAAPRVTVPAGGTAAVALTARTSVAGPDGLWGGRVVATGAGGARAVTPFGVHREVESYDVTFVHLGRDGKPSSTYSTLLFDGTATGSPFIDVFDPSGTATVRVPKGEYAASSRLFTGLETEDDFADDTVSVLARPTLLPITKNQRIVVDARAAKPVRVTVPHRDAKAALAAINTDWTTEEWGLSAGTIADSFDGTFAGPLGSNAPSPIFRASVNAAFGRPNADPAQGLRNSPYWYDLAWRQEDRRMFEGLRRTVRPRDVATISASFAKQAEGVWGGRMSFPYFPGDEWASGWATLVPFELPARRTQYVNTAGGLRWDAEFREELIPASPDEWPESVSGTSQAPATYRAGRTYRETWNRAVFGPALGTPPVPEAWASRTGDTILAAVPLAGDGDGRVGWSTTTDDVVRAALYRNGTLEQESTEGFVEAEVPARSAAYRLEFSQQRGAPHTLSTSVSAVWTFRSGHVGGEKPARLPLSTVRFSPPVDLTNTVRGKRPTLVDVHLERQPGSAAGRNRTLTVEASFDDGRTWRKVPLLGRGADRVAVVGAPHAAGFVSLRATAKDVKGNTVTQTVLRAYRIG
ncbi:S8 family serine peptidase [Spirilliplanes yamanashiensis]|uniref:Serine protease n=1 Tax=Spirilliplanes yamanashiensis TaxID=42233 RepID=A0A8J3Y8E8_9ACTN|nr:S8 family serine peptidase [Spirilliplanes yamanashiensis]MDP9816935.1 subtilisin family serine protease [Spirilliplanes yamanashiensis]GIJ03410.1 serine protease [Spirilliplanes yamanashiensis]